MWRARWRTGAIPSSRPWAADADTQAAWWHGRLLDAPGPRTQAAFDAWHASDPAHGEAFARVDAAWNQARASGDMPAILSLRQATLARVVARPRRWPQRMALAASVAAVLLIGAWTFPRGAPDERATQVAAVQPNLYRTGVGERLQVTLADGSTLMLNTASRVRIAYGEGERRIVLEAGQALFDVAKDPRRPFVVAAGDRLVTALGTRFDVKLGRSAIEVKLIEGSVTVAPARQGAAPEVKLRPNEILTASAGATRVRREADIAQLTSWRDGLIIFEDEPLAQAVAEVNRYTRQRIVLSDEQVGRIRISGAFRTGETDAFVEALELGFGVEVVDANPATVVLASAE